MKRCFWCKKLYRVTATGSTEHCANCKDVHEKVEAAGKLIAEALKEEDTLRDISKSLELLTKVTSKELEKYGQEETKESYRHLDGPLRPEVFKMFIHKNGETHEFDVICQDRAITELEKMAVAISNAKKHDTDLIFEHFHPESPFGVRVFKKAIVPAEVLRGSIIHLHTLSGSSKMNNDQSIH